MRIDYTRTTRIATQQASGGKGFDDFANAVEFDGKDTFFGWVYGDYPELGYFSLSELASVHGPYGLPVERDTGFAPIPLSQVKKLHNL